MSQEFDEKLAYAEAKKYMNECDVNRNPHTFSPWSFDVGVKHGFTQLKSQLEEKDAEIQRLKGYTISGQEIIIDELKQQLEEMNKNCISLSLHESRMNEVEKKLTWFESGKIHSCHADCQREACLLRRQLEEARDILEVVVEVNDEDCYYDHHGYCQAHNLEEDCHIARSKKWLEENKK